MDYLGMLQQLLKGSGITIIVFCATYVMALPLGMLVHWGCAAALSP